jgi:hypothetical protein
MNEALKQKCAECGNEFEGRKNQKFCSTACKQKNFTEKKTSEANEPVQRIRLKLSDYKKFIEMDLDNTRFGMDFFFFLQNILGFKTSTEIVAEYFNSLMVSDSDFEKNYKDKKTEFGSKFSEFKERMYSAEFEIVE